MARILFAYEFGAGLGHLNRLRAVAERLRGGHALLFALPDPAIARAALQRSLGESVPVHQGLVWPAPKDPKAREVPTHTFADVVRLFGFHDVARLEAGVQHWLALLRELRPDLIVADFAPTLRLASQGRVPTIVVGNGYTVPPGGRVLMPMRPWRSEVPPDSRAHEGELLAAVNAVRARIGGPAVDHVADLFHGEASFVCTLAEFDPYRRARSEPPLWPFNVPTIPTPPAGLARDRLFAYFDVGHPALGAALAALEQLGLRAEIYVQGADPRAIAARCSRHVGVHTKPADFAAVLPRAAVLLHHAGLGTAYAGLVAGVPQVVLPLNLEHAITTAGLEALGTASRVQATPPPEPATVFQALSGVLDGGPQRSAAVRAAGQLAARRDPLSVDRVVRAAQDHLC